MAARGWTGLIAGASLALAGCMADPDAPPPGLALTGEPLVNSSCRAVAAGDRLTVHLRDSETMIACPPGIIPGSVYRDVSPARLIARPRGWSVYAVPPAPPPRAARSAAPSIFEDYMTCIGITGPAFKGAATRCAHLRQ